MSILKKNVCTTEVLKILCLCVFLGIVSFLFLTKSPLHIWIGSDTGTDSSVFLTVAMMMDKGYMPYRDSFDHKGPLLFLIDYVGRKIAVYRGVWLIEFISMFITLLFIYKIARLKCSRILSCIVIMISLSLLFAFFKEGNLSEEYALPFIAGSMFVFLDYFINEKISAIRLISCGLCFGGVCLLRPNMISLWVVFCIAVLIKCIRNKEFQELRMFIILFLVGFFIIVFPIIVWLALNHCLKDCWYASITFNFMYSSVASNFERWSTFLVYFKEPTVIITTLISGYMFFVSRNRFLYGTYCCYLVCTFIFICVAGRGYNHYGMILVPAVAFPVASMFERCREYFPVNKGRVEAFFLTAFFMCISIIPAWYPVLVELPTIYEKRNEENNSGLVNEVCRIVSSNTQVDDKISVYGMWDIIYILSDRAHATKYGHQSSLRSTNPEIMQEYFEELKEEEPPIIVIQSGHYDDEIETFLDENDYSLIWSEADNDTTKTLIYKR